MSTRHVIAALRIRPLGGGDIGALAGVLARAYESQQDFELRLRSYLQTPALATLVAEFDGRPVGMVVGNDYRSVAYVSHMAVEPALQRRGIGRALMDALLAWADTRQFAAVELDATESGAALYAGYGFVESGQTRVYLATTCGGDGRAARPYGARDRAAIFAADSQAFGADRSDVLSQLLDSGYNAIVVSGPPGRVDGYAVAQLRLDLLGPVVAPNAAAAARLIDAARAHFTALHRTSVPSANLSVEAIFTARGYRFSRSLVHMIRGVRPAAAAQELFARINLGQG